uniref:G-protein coupled receptors family 1 profile domain-containing protein n=1 Tax=Plectus sambesii TaxID=2011161 RepID=A0A914UZR4_9BILA
MAIGCVIQGISRQVVLIQTLLVPDSNNSTGYLFFCWLVGAVYMAAIHIVSLSLIALAIERFIATINAKTYETKQSIVLGVGLVTFQWIYACGVVLISKLVEESEVVGETTCSSQGYMSGGVILTSLCIVLLTSVIAVAIFIVLLHTNKKRYETTFLNRSLHSLSERYQLSENIKTTRLLFPVVTANAICSFLCIFIGIFIIACDAESAIAKILVQVALYIVSLLLPGYAAIFPWLSAFGHPELQKEMQKTLRCCLTERIVPEQPKNANGVELILNREHEQSAHFEAMNNAWNA